MSLLERDRWIQDAAASLPGPVGGTFLRVLMFPEAERATLIRRLHQDHDTQSLAEFLIDLEEDRQLAFDFAQALKKFHAPRVRRSRPIHVRTPPL